MRRRPAVTALVAGSLSATLLLAAAPAVAQVATFRSEPEFLAAVSALGLCIDAESFEDDAVWGGVRSTITGGFHTAPSIANLGVTWTPNTPVCGVTTGEGPARTGSWGFYQYPHGDPLNGVNDGWVITSTAPLYAVGAWVRGTFGAKVDILLDGAVTDFGGPNHIGTAYVFLGAIDPAGFTGWEIVETEGNAGEWLFLWAEDFTFARAAGGCETAIFRDGFESGDLAAWSGSVGGA